MSSSEHFPDWDAFSEREIPFEVTDFLSPAAEVVAILQHSHLSLAQARQQEEHSRHENLAILAQMAVLVYQFEVRVHDFEARLQESEAGQEAAFLKKSYRSLRILKDQMRDALSRAGLEIDIPLGVPYHEVADRVEIENWRHRAEFTAEIVAEVLEPIISYQGSLLRLGRVIMGAPLAENDAISNE